MSEYKVCSACNGDQHVTNKPTHYRLVCGDCGLVESVTKTERGKPVEQLEFETALYAYVAELATPAVVNSSHKTLQDLNTRFGTSRVQSALAIIWKQERAGKRVYCLDWDVQDSETIHYVFDADANKVVGQLIPVDYELIANSAGIQEWSKRASA